MVQTPYPISGTVTVDGSLYQGAHVWVRDMTEGSMKPPIEDVTYFYTNALGQYLIDIANNTDAYADGDKIRVYCKVGNIETFSDVNINLAAGSATVNFTITRKSGMVDGMKGSRLATQKGGLTSSNLNPGLKDGMS
jgi:hypothetical protein